MGELIGPDVKAVIFDWDDTLVATIESKWPQHRHIARTHYGLELSDDDLRTHWGSPLEKLLAALYQTEDIDQAFEHIYAVNADFPKRLYDETLGVLEHLRASEKIVGLVTAHRRIGLDHDFELLGMSPSLFDYIQTSDDTKRHKPDPEVFRPTLAFLRRFNILPEQTVYVGDGMLDMQAAIGAGMGFIGVETGLVSAEQFRQAGATAIGSLVELIN